jgi:hypothetical protein
MRRLAAQRAMECGFALEQRSRAEVSAVQPQQLEGEEGRGIVHGGAPDAFGTADGMPVVQPVPLRPALIIEHDELGIRNEIAGDWQDLRNKRGEAVAHVPAIARLQTHNVAVLAHETAEAVVFQLVDLARRREQLPRRGEHQVAMADRRRKVA